MYALVKDNQVVKLFTGTTQFEDKDGIGYAPSYLQQWSSTEKTNRGIYEVVYGNSNDSRFYNIVENLPTFENSIVTVTYTSTAKELNDSASLNEDGSPEQTGLKTQWIKQFKTTANSMLATTDWMVVRKIERSIDIPADVVAKRAAIVAESDRLETAISAVTTVEQLISVVESANFAV